MRTDIDHPVLVDINGDGDEWISHHRERPIVQTVFVLRRILIDRMKHLDVWIGDQYTFVQVGC